MRRLLLCFLIALALPQAAAAEEFVVSDIRVEGLQRIEPGTVFNYLPIKVGDEVDDELTTDAVKELFETGFFTDVELRRRGTVLVVAVKERPSIAQIAIKGNRDLRDEAIEESLNSVGLSEGRIFNQALLDRFLSEVRDQYFTRGRYSATVEATVSPRPLNRVAVVVNIDEGRVARIKQIRIVGNEAYDDKELLDEFQLAGSRAFRLFSRRDRFSEEKLRGDVENLRSFYQDNGYLNFQLNSTDVSISQNKQDIFITISISEGGRFVVGSIDVEAVEGVPAEDLESLVTIMPGEVFSRRAVAEMRVSLAGALADRGYAFAEVNPITEIDEEENKVSFTFAIDPGPKVYVRRIEITGNTGTRDEVIRREMRQLEGAVFSAAKVQRSRVRLNRLEFFQSVAIETRPVPGVPDQVDVVVNVTERPTGSVLFGVGYSDADGVLLQASVTQKNLLGSGKELEFRIDNSSVTDVYEIQYTDPYHTPSGISRNIRVSNREVDAGEADTADYLSESSTVGVGYGIPVSEFDVLRASFDFERVELEPTSGTPREFRDFIEDQGESDNLKVRIGYGRDTRDSIFFPSSGYQRRITLETVLPGSDLEYYKLDLHGSWYKSLTRSKKLVLKLQGELGYGDGYGDLDELPFFKNYFAGGPNSVRGYDSRSLGPKESGGDRDPIGGSRKIVAGAELIFPVPGTEDANDKRLGLFMDAGMVYGSGESIDFGEIRVSAGLSFSWFSPVGPLIVSYAVPLNEKEGDDVEEFQLSLGTLLR